MWIEKDLNNIEAPQWYQQNGSEYNLLEKLYNVIFYSDLEYIHQLRMLSYVKYRNSNIMWIKKNQNIIYAPQCWKQNCSEYNMSVKIYNALF